MKKSLKVKERIKYVKGLIPDRQLEVAEKGCIKAEGLCCLCSSTLSLRGGGVRTLSKSRPTAASDHASNFVNVGKGFLVPAS